MSSISALVKSSKKVLRNEVTKQLQALKDAEVERQSSSVLRRLLELEAFHNSRIISCYLSMKGEVDTSPIVHEILGSGRRLFVPNIANRKDGRMDMLEIYSDQDIASLPSGKWGIREPAPEWQGRRRASIFDDDTDPLEVVLVPGVAFDREMSRLGHGKGYYDYFVNEYSVRRTKPCLIALALSEQMLERGRIPMAEHDRRMDFIVTPDSVLMREGWSSSH